MKEFVMSALPLILVGISLAVVVSYKKQNNYILEGMFFGTCYGILFASSVDMNLGLLSSLGMFIGEVIGIIVKKR